MWSSILFALQDLQRHRRLGPAFGAVGSVFLLEDLSRQTSQGYGAYGTRHGTSSEDSRAVRFKGWTLCTRSIGIDGRDSDSHGGEFDRATTVGMVHVLEHQYHGAQFSRASERRSWKREAERIRWWCQPFRSVKSTVRGKGWEIDLSE